MVCVTRKCRFSSAHYYYNEELSDVENQALYGPCANRHGHGHNYELEVAVDGEINPDTAMVMNLTDLRDILREEVVEPFDFRNLNEEIPHFKEHTPSLEGIILYVWERLEARLSAGALSLLWARLWEKPDFFIEYSGEDSRMLYLTRVYDFCASHRLYNPALGEQENLRIFGKCSNPNGHGHNYQLEVTLRGTIDPSSGFMVDLPAFDQAVQEKILDWVDHKHLNHDVPFLEDIIPTSENLVVAFWGQLESAVPKPAHLHRLRLIETRKNFAEYFGDQPCKAPSLLEPEAVSAAPQPSAS